MRKLNIVLGDLCYVNKHTRLILYTPQNIGFIASYTQKIFPQETDVSIFKDPHTMLDNIKTKKPDIVGLAYYFWNADLNGAMIRKIRKLYGQNVIIVLGGPSIDTDPIEQVLMLKRLSNVNALIPNEGEVGFANVVKSVLSGENFNKPINGAVFLKNGILHSGEYIGLSTDLAQIESPYLNGRMDLFLNSHFQPLLQTSRLCPYTCSFCVSGKNKGKLRAFDIDQVKDEITYVAKRYVDRPHFTLYISDENFGILKRDVEIAEHILETSKNIGWPQNVFFYNDKRFTQTSRDVVKILGKINNNGMTLALQTENPETLKEIKRTNISSDQIDEAIQWAASENIRSTTELIFGLPYETKTSFVEFLERSVERGFDSILVNNLFLMEGIEMNRSKYREQHDVNTKFRILGTNYGIFDGEFTSENEEVIVSTKHFSFDDYIAVRYLSFLFYSVYNLNIYKWFFNYIRYCDISLLKFFDAFMNPDLNQQWPEDYLRFVTEVKSSFKDELFDSKEEIIERTREIYQKNNGDVGDPDRLNVFLGSKLIYLERNWLNEVLKKHFCNFANLDSSPQTFETVDMLLDLCYKEWIDLRAHDFKGQELPYLLKYDLLEWKRNKFRKPLEEFPMEPTMLNFSIEEFMQERIRSFQKDFGGQVDKDFYYNAFMFINPKERLKFDQSYAPASACVS